jgi:hypothetical protein
MRMSKKDQAMASGFMAKVQAEGQIGKDMGMLRDLVGALSEAAAKGGYDGKTAAGHLTAFSDILDRMESGQQQTLTEKQRSYLKSVHSQHCKGESYRNDWSAGRVEEGKKVERPEVLKRLPLSPPGRPPSWKVPT